MGTVGMLFFIPGKFESAINSIKYRNIYVTIIG